MAETLVIALIHVVATPFQPMNLLINCSISYDQTYKLFQMRRSELG